MFCLAVEEKKSSGRYQQFIVMLLARAWWISKVRLRRKKRTSTGTGGGCKFKIDGEGGKKREWVSREERAGKRIKKKARTQGSLNRMKEKKRKGFNSIK